MGITPITISTPAQKIAGCILNPLIQLTIKGWKITMQSEKLFVILIAIVRVSIVKHAIYIRDK